MPPPHPPTPDTVVQKWAIAATEARLDGVRFTARGVAYDDVLESLLGRLPPGSRYIRKDKNACTPRLALIEVPDDNNIGLRYVRDQQDVYVDCMGPLAETVRQVGVDLADTFLPRAQCNWPQSVRISRIDACLDFDDPGAFDKAISAARSAVTGYKGKRPAVDQRGDWENPEKGRTLYVGSRDSVLCRIYEKGKQLRYVKGVDTASDDHIRVETEAHPADLEAFRALRWTPMDILATSRISLAAIFALSGTLPAFVRSRDAGTRSTTVRKLLACRDQYGPLFWDLARRYDSPEAAARVLVATFLQANPTAERVQKMLERGVSAPELQADLFGYCPAEA